jgi:hypothetical protein
MAHLSPVPNGYVPFKAEGRCARRLHRDGIYPSKVQAAAARTMLLKVVDAVQWLIDTCVPADRPPGGPVGGLGSLIYIHHCFFVDGRSYLMYSSVQLFQEHMHFLFPVHAYCS